jgi:hypothetical protein
MSYRVRKNSMAGETACPTWLEVTGLPWWRRRFACVSNAGKSFSAAWLACGQTGLRYRAVPVISLAH